ncbi:MULTISPECIES: Gfo/Idh/MocA family oxidoreductase [unclassified Chelatococcus]|uniref:Gfo/Idh/MocA family protein n=1 Tax=unclassified Chelatococcus TaxID=2638111 RepID=UPI001BCBB300|nr:Gfo/Idh/MocA family oxidoreductase [Chelatococcus sp.]MBS7697663.1 Gfo/Idh/MocA family oxidoreductase [Chelatococcus sp. YT9]MBX3559037.1 Gfo/Idh/MocA family oxidoreductase [Chelatococcus sp.]
MAGRIEIAVIGAAHQHVDYVLDEVARRDDVGIVAVVEHDPARRATLEQRTGAPGYAEVETMLERHRIDAASVVTEFGARAGIVTTLAQRGIFAIVDKPLAVTRAGLDALEAALDGRPLVALMLEKRFYPVTLALRGLVADGVIGEIVTIHATGPHKFYAARRPGWMFDADQYGGILADLTVHDIDLALWLIGGTRGTVAGWVSAIDAPGVGVLPGKRSFPGAGRAILTVEGGPQVAVEVDWLQPEASPRHGDYAMRITGTRGRADVLFAEDKLLVETHDTPLREWPLPPGEPPARFALDHLARGEPLAVPTPDALRATRIAILAQESAAAGGRALEWA